MFALLANKKAMLAFWLVISAVSWILTLSGISTSSWVLSLFDVIDIAPTIFTALGITTIAFLATKSFRFPVWNVRLFSLVAVFLGIGLLNAVVFGGDLFPDSAFNALMFFALAFVGFLCRLAEITGIRGMKGAGKNLNSVSGEIISVGSYNQHNEENEYSYIDIKDREAGVITRITSIRAAADIADLIAPGRDVVIFFMSFRFLFLKMKTVVRLDAAGRSHVPNQKSFVTNVATFFAMLLVFTLIIGFFTFLIFIPLLWMTVAVAALWYVFTYTIYRFALSAYAAHAGGGNGGTETGIVRTI
ncbi:hypothetical protein G6L28_21055 [Agrobacterium larrymoorei]|uniref:hypothetical protein n=1 Tax=Agrobacterium larrymoorei TaxID=160699 RepID=UPI001571C1C6|nr:hypothetical protein [Agrobacterium larrymoorei]NTJ45078.1 hypothetical protein [Agrobacterium larrymoorei]